jgi:hypothetical protein
MRTPPERRRRLRIDPSFIDLVNAPVSDEEVCVTRETLSLLRTLPFEEAGRLLGHIIMAAEHDGAIPESAPEKKILRVHKRIIKAEVEGPPKHDNHSAARQYRRDRETLGLDARPTGAPRKT